MQFMQTLFVMDAAAFVHSMEGQGDGRAAPVPERPIVDLRQDDATVEDLDAEPDPAEEQDLHESRLTMTTPPSCRRTKVLVLPCRDS